MPARSELPADSSLTGWLLDVYPDPASGEVVVWILGEDGQRRRLRQAFPVTFYAAGPALRLRQLWRSLQALTHQTPPFPLQLSRQDRFDLFVGRDQPVLAVQVGRPDDQSLLFRRVSEAFPDLTFYDADISLALRYAVATGAFPLARCRCRVDGDRLLALETLDSPWDVDVEPPPLRILTLEPDVDPARASPQSLRACCERQEYRLPLRPERPLLINLRAILERHDPDLLLTAWGDTWLLPHLLEISKSQGLALPLNRDAACEPAHRPERSYFSYGQIVYVGRQVLLFGRWHIDRGNAMLWDDYDLEGVLEAARVTAQPVQTAARTSPGTGISSMQVLTALRDGILVPWHKQQVEEAKNALDLFASDQGGLIYQPLVGLHRDVGAIDFVSMYPGIMVRFNISPETINGQRPDVLHLLPLESPPGILPLEANGPGEQPGLVPRTLKPLLGKRLELKRRLAELPAWDPRRKVYKARASAHKWLLVTCFGYLGYKNARFGRIEAHEAVTAYGREALLRAKEAAEDLGYTVLHMYVDGLWVKREGPPSGDAPAPADFQPLLEEVAERTGLPIALDGIYRWVAFLPSRVDGRVPVPNRYFGVFQDGSLKVRGIEARRRDSAPFIVEMQMEILELLAQAPDAVQLRGCLPQAVGLVRKRWRDLRQRRIPLEKLVVSQRLTREVEAYKTPSPAARAVMQLQGAGKSVRPGQRVRLIFMRGRPGVRAWDLPEAPDPAGVDVERYSRLLLRAAEAVLWPLGVTEQALEYTLRR